MDEWVAFKEIPQRELRNATFLTGIIFAAVHSGLHSPKPCRGFVFMLPAFLLLAVVGVL